MNLQFVLLMGGLVIAASTLYGLSRERIRAEYSVGWLTVGAALAVTALFRGGGVSAWPGLDAQLCFLIVGAALLGVAVHRATRILSRFWDERVALAQRAAIVEFRMRRDKHGNGSKVD